MSDWYQIDGVLVLERPPCSTQIKRIHRGAGKPTWRYEVFKNGVCVDHYFSHSQRQAKQYAEASLARVYDEGLKGTLTK